MEPPETKNVLERMDQTASPSSLVACGGASPVEICIGDREPDPSDSKSPVVAVAVGFVIFFRLDVFFSVAVQLPCPYYYLEMLCSLGRGVENLLLLDTIVDTYLLTIVAVFGEHHHLDQPVRDYLTESTSNNVLKGRVDFRYDRFREEFREGRYKNNT